MLYYVYILSTTDSFVMFYSHFVIYFHFELTFFGFDFIQVTVLYRKPVLFVQMCFSLPKTVASINISRSSPCVFSMPSSSGIQACYNDPVMLCDRPGRVLAVCVNPDQSLPLLDRQRHQCTERSQGVLKPGLMWWAGRSAEQVNTLDWLSKKKNWYSIVDFCKGRIKWLVVISPDLQYVSDSPVTGRVQKVLSLLVILIDIPVGKMSPWMPYIRQGLHSLMIRVNMAHGLHFYRRAGRNNTIAKIQAIWEKNNKKQHLTAQNALHPGEQPQLLLHVRRGEL